MMANTLAIQFEQLDAETLILDFEDALGSVEFEHPVVVSHELNLVACLSLSQLCYFPGHCEISCCLDSFSSFAL
jgi:hypothetical protein